MCVQHLDQGVAATAGRREDEDEHVSRREPEARVVVDEVPQHELVCGGRLWGATVQWYVRHARGCYAYAVRTVRGAWRQAALCLWYVQYGGPGVYVSAQAVTKETRWRRGARKRSGAAQEEELATSPKTARLVVGAAPLLRNDIQPSSGAVGRSMLARRAHQRLSPSLEEGVIPGTVPGR